MTSSVVRRTTLISLIVLAGALGATACAAGGTQGNPPPASTSSGVGSLGTGPSSSASGTGPGAPTTAAAVVYPSDAKTYAIEAVNAWVTGDTARLDQLEVSGGTIHTLAACGGCYNLQWSFVGTICQGAAGSSYCLFYNHVGDSLRVHISNPALGGPQAVVLGSIWDPLTFPADDQAYAAEALAAWQGGNDARLSHLTTGWTTAKITALGADPAGSWQYHLSQGAAGSFYVQFSDGSGHDLAFRFVNWAIVSPGPIPTTGPGAQHRITDIERL
jgi:hypothetical protein